MKISYDRIRRDYLALLGESPDLLPILEEGEESAVLTLDRQLKARLPDAAVKATLETPPEENDTLKTVTLRALESDAGLRVSVYALPDDFLKLHRLALPDCVEEVRETEPEGTLRRRLGANAPRWMACSRHPMVTLEGSPEGARLRVYGSVAVSATLTYAPRPSFDGESLEIAKGAERRLLKELCNML